MDKHWPGLMYALITGVFLAIIAGWMSQSSINATVTTEMQYLHSVVGRHEGEISGFDKVNETLTRMATLMEGILRKQSEIAADTRAMKEWQNKREATIDEAREYIRENRLNGIRTKGGK